MKSNRSYVQLDPAVIEQARQMDLPELDKLVPETTKRILFAKNE